MLKKTISAALALSLVLGGATALPEGFLAQSGITASAEETQTFGDFEYFISDDDKTVELTKYNGTAASLDIPSSINGKTVTVIGDSAFHECKRLKSVTIPSTVTTIRWFAFEDCISLETVKMANSVTKLDKDAFRGCISLKNVTLSNAINTLEDETFMDCTGLTSITIPEGITEINTQAFAYCRALKKIVIPKSVVRIESDNVFVEDSLLVIHGYKGSAAIIFAKENNLEYQLIDAASIAKAKVGTIKAQTYTGSAIRPEPTVKLNGKTLKNGTDYTLSYKNNKKVGTATVTIKGKRDYTGTVTATFKINPKATSVKKVTSPKTKQLKVTYKKVSGVTGYQVTYSTSKKFTKKTTKTATVKGVSKTSKTIKKLKKGKTYYVKVRAYKTVSGKKYYSKYTAVKRVKVK